jgi:hypothetical protein
MRPAFVMTFLTSKAHHQKPQTTPVMANLFPHLVAGASTGATSADSTPMDDTGKLLFHDLLKRQQFAAPNAPKCTRSNAHQTSSQS